MNRKWTADNYWVSVRNYCQANPDRWYTLTNVALGDLLADVLQQESELTALKAENDTLRQALFARQAETEAARKDREGPGG